MVPFTSLWIWVAKALSNLLWEPAGPLNITNCSNDAPKLDKTVRASSKSRNLQSLWRPAQRSVVILKLQQYSRDGTVLMRWHSSAQPVWKTHCPRDDCSLTSQRSVTVCSWSEDGKTSPNDGRMAFCILSIPCWPWTPAPLVIHSAAMSRHKRAASRPAIVRQEAVKSAFAVVWAWGITAGLGCGLQSFICGKVRAKAVSSVEFHHSTNKSPPPKKNLILCFRALCKLFAWTIQLQREQSKSLDQI